MKIGVIGIGEIGGTLARKWSARGHNLRVANSRGPEAVREFADEIGAGPVDIYGAVEDADVVLIAIPFPAVAKLPKDLFNRASEDVTIIDTGNYYPDVRDPRIAEIDAGMPESVWISQQLGRPIFKAFNSILFHSLFELGRPEGSPGRLAIPVAGDEANAKQIVMGLVNEAGFDQSMAVPWTNHGGSSLQRLLIVAIMMRKKREKASRQLSGVRRKRYGITNGGRITAGSLSTSRPMLISMRITSQ